MEDLPPNTYPYSRYKLILCFIGGMVAAFLLLTSLLTAR